MDVVAGIPLHTVLLRATALCYYLIFGSVGDALVLSAWLLWARGPQILTLFEFNFSDIVIPALVVAISTLVYFSYKWRRSGAINSPVWKGPGRPLLFPCQTTHTRFFPEKHSFSYSYLLVGIPVGWTGAAGGMISNDERGTSIEGWYKVDAADYLERGNGHLGLRGKLDAYLESQGVNASGYPYAYLVTAAKFLGYHFNPVSFWYLYSADKCLAAMVLEVNNTFDERRMYYLTTDDAMKSMETTPTDSLDGSNEAHRANSSKPLKRTWQKDFHVSPFNSRKGAYSLAAYDPLLPDMEGRGPINNTINLISSKSHAKLVARIFSNGDAIDPTEMTFLQKYKFLASWWWVGFVTFPRIVKEAALLFFQRKLHVWYRPEPLKTSIGRRADSTERQLEPLFRDYLKHLVEDSPEPLIVEYAPSGIADARVAIMMSTSARENPDAAERMEFRILTPAFYSRFVYYAHDFEAIFCELNENNTIWVSKPGLLPKLFVKKQPPPLLQTASYLNYGYFTAIKNLRQRPERIERPLTSSQIGTTTHSKKDIRGFRLSSMDGYILAREDTRSRRCYRNLVLKLFIADRIAMGSVDILQLEHWILKLSLAWVAIS
ncbi:uncharacterized protein F4822DRAFT_427764 [Hypoxylon trugodes]|uniref:uncharacterized protein n=1 Tax=Hypoxylon trugodes TaxID=326681 RepID=UPI00219D769B|nr:uncharacterized protein F4822DRAFT_427764 [Hypoxylon trugodes]KAI1389413.1 hypothetical protein F4822DRAFT_427764 [Hypoxylon trugodes]